MYALCWQRRGEVREGWKMMGLVGRSGLDVRWSWAYVVLVISRMKMAGLAEWTVRFLDAKGEVFFLSFRWCDMVLLDMC